MNKPHLLYAICAGIITLSVVPNAHTATYHIDQFIQDNGTNTFTDTFSDGLEPPAGPFSGSDYIVFGTFGNNRETGGLLELNANDGNLQEDDIELVVAVSNSNYFFSSGSGGYLEGTFKINNDLAASPYFGIGIDNYQIPKPGGNDESAGMGVFVDSTGTIYAFYGHEENDNIVDITSAFGTNTQMTMRFSVDSVTNNLTADFDFGSDGTIDLTASNYATLQFVGGQYTGTFQLGLEAVLVPSANTIFDWAENNYPQYFPPPGASTQFFDPWLYRYYPTTNIYVGVNTSSEVWVQGDVFGGLIYINTVEELLAIISPSHVK